MASPRRSILITAVAAVLAAGGGFGAAAFVLSPADAAARAAPPPAGPITVPVERKVLTLQITTRGDVAFADPADITLPAGGQGQQVVTGRIPETGTAVAESMVLLEVSGRPVIVLAGSFPTYRSLAPGSKGPDVVQLQDALKRLGLYEGTATGTYDPATAAAVDRLYAKVGYSSPAAGQEAMTALEQAKTTLRSAQQQLTTAQGQYDQLAAPPSESEKLAAQAEIDAAATGLDKARNTPSAPDQEKVAAAQKRLDAAKSDLQEAQQALAAELAALQQLQKATPVDQEAVRDAQQRIEAARRTADQAAQSVSTRSDELSAAAAEGPPDQAAISAAENALAIAQAKQRELLNGKDTDAAKAAVAAARKTVDAAQADLAKAQAAVATPLPAAEVVFLDGLPRRVDEVKVSKGSVVNGVVMTVSGAKLRVSATVTADEAKLLKKGMSATLTSPTSDPVPATVQSVELTTDQDKKTKVWTVTLDPGSPSAATAKNLAGSNVKVTVGIGSTQGEVLSVPTAALFSDSRGRTRVEVATGSKPGQGTRFQFVKVGLTAGGDVQVTPVDENGTTLPAGADTLTENTLVVVGR